MTANDEIREEIKQLHKDFSQLRGDVGGLVQALRAAGLEGMESAKSGVNEELHTRREQVRSVFGKARTQSEAALENMEDSIATHPLSSLAMAFGLGFIIAKLIDGGRH